MNIRFSDCIVTEIQDDTTNSLESWLEKHLEELDDITYVARSLSNIADHIYNGKTVVINMADMLLGSRGHSTYELMTYQICTIVFEIVAVTGEIGMFIVPPSEHNKTMAKSFLN